MANTLLTPTAITREALMVLHNNLEFVSRIDRQHDNKIEFGGQKAGGTIAIRKPPQYSVRTGATIDVQDATETSSTLTVGTQKGVDLQFTSKDLTLSIDDFSDRFIKPALSRLASAVDADAFSMYNKVYNLVGTAGTTPQTALVYLTAGAKLSDFCAPKSDRHCIISPETQAYTVDALKALFHSGASIEKQYKSGDMGQALGFDFAMSQNVPSHTTGTRTNTTPLVDDAAGANNTEGSTTIHIDGLAAATATITAGDVFTVAGVYAVNPETKQTLPFLKQFVVASNVTAASNECDITLTEGMYTSASGGLQNISAFPANDAAVTFYSATASTSYGQNLAFHKDAFTFATANLVVPKGVDFARREVMDGLSLRIVRDYDINNDNFPCRIDILYGYLAQRPEWACRVTD